MRLRAILKTLIYADIFDYPLKAYEIHKWLIGEKCSLFELEKDLEKLIKQKKIESKRGFYFLKKRGGLVKKRQEREKISQHYLEEVRSVAKLFKIIPWIKLVGVSGSLAMLNSDKKDDVDLFVVTEVNKLWICRILLLVILEVLGKRRKRGEKIQDVSGKYCINLILEEDSLGLDKENLYLAHEILQMRLVWQRDEVYSKYLSDNLWVFNLLPNWVSTLEFKTKNHPSTTSTTSTSSTTLTTGPLSTGPLSIGPLRTRKSKIKKFGKNNRVMNYLEKIAKIIQLKIMGRPDGDERISEKMLFLHPQDNGKRILGEYKKRIARN